MTTADTLQQAAMSAPEKDVNTQAHLGTVATLRGKGYSWRDIAAFMAETLTAEKIWCSSTGDLAPALRCGSRLKIRLAQTDGEAVSQMNAPPQFARVSRDAQYSQPFRFQGLRLW